MTFRIHLTSVVLLGLLASIFFFTSCEKEKQEEEVMQENYVRPALPSESFNYADLDLPDHFDANELIGGFTTLAEANNTPPENPVTDAGATLGRVLFYDKNLSQNGTVSCSSCHQQEHGFSDPEIFSIGFEGGLTGRHSMGLTNAAYYNRGRFFWDERASTLEEQVLMPFQDPVEMGLTLDELEDKVRSRDFYSDLFIDAFGDGSITSERISLALAQFVRSMVSYRSKYDLCRQTESDPFVDFAEFTDSENLGKTLFITPISQGGLGCTDCHSTEGFINILSGPTSNGLDSVQNAIDPGYYGVTSVDSDLNTFKTPSLKNVAVRAPYMHDGRFASLEEVIEHYDSGVNFHPSIPFTLIDASSNPVEYGLRPDEKVALIDFLNTLTDEPMLTDEKFSDPFED